MQLKRVGLHITFWLFFYCIGVYNELFLSSSFLSDPTFAMAAKGFLAQLCLLLVKIAGVYYVLNRFIPQWIKVQGRKKLYAECVLVFVFLVFVYRLMIHLVIWPYIYEEEPGNIPSFSFVARVFYSLLDIFQVVGIAAAIKLFKLRMAAINNEKELIKQKLESEMLHLKAQINPHFLFNSLNSIYSLSRTQSDVAPDTVIRLSKILRYMLYESEKKLTTVDEELKIINNYVELQQLRFANTIKMQYKEHIDNKAEPIPPLLLLPLIENAYKFGGGSVDDPATIEVSIELQQGQLKVMVKNLIAKESVEQKEHKGIGLANIKRQLELLYRDYKMEYGKNEENFIVNLNINLLTYAGFELFDSGR